MDDMLSKTQIGKIYNLEKESPYRDINSFCIFPSAYTNA